MKAVGVVPTKKEVALLEHAEPNLSSADQVRVQTLDVGICGTDREICTFVYGDPPKGSDYLVLGHEALGQVIEVGAEVKNLKVGDFVVPSVRRPCSDPICRSCVAGLQDFCFTGDFVERGIKEMHGYMTEQFVEAERYLTAVPPELRNLAVMAEPLTIAEKGFAQAYAVQSRLPWATPGDQPGKGLNAVVIGAGPIGILGAMKCIVEGFNTYVYSRSEAPNPKADLLESIGAEYISNKVVSLAELAARVGNIDLVYEAVGVTSVSFDVLDVLGMNGVYIFTGIPEPDSRDDIATGALMRNMVLKNQAVVGTVNADPNSFAEAIADLGEFQRRWPKAIDSVISGRFSLEDYESLLVGKATGIKNVISFDA